MKFRFIKSSEKRNILALLNEQFGIEDLPYLLIETGKGKLRGYSGSLSKDEISKLAELANIEIIGTYLIRKEEEKDLRLSFDATQILNKQITKNIIELDETQMKKWMRGHDLEIPAQKGVYVLKFKDDFIGCGKSNGSVIFNYVPKDRRLRK